MKASVGKKPLKILFLSQRFLFPMDTGGKIRTGKLLEKLNETFDITLVSNVESPKDDIFLNKIETLCTEFYSVPWKEIKKYSIAFYLKTLWRMLSRYPVTVINDYSKTLEFKILELLKNNSYDLLICDFLQPSLNFRKVVGYPTILFQHNVESVILKRHLETSSKLFKKLFWRLQLGKMETYEKDTCENFTGVVAVSEVDKLIMKKRFSLKNVFDIPTGIDTEYFSPRDEPFEENSLVFTGSLDWLPNEDAILFFAKKILKKIKEQIPTIKLTVVGRNPSNRLITELKGFPEIQIVGWVKDIRPYISRHALYVIPLRIGGGTRIKVYEAMAMAKAVVSTSIGCEGLMVKSGINVILADDADSFAHAVVRLLKSPKTRKQIEKSARELVVQNCSWDIAAKEFANICLNIQKMKSA